MSETKLTARDLALIDECDRYSVSDDGSGYYRLGGHGYAPIRYNHASLRRLRRGGWVDDSAGYYKATPAGRAALSEGER